MQHPGTKKHDGAKTPSPPPTDSADPRSLVERAFDDTVEWMRPHVGDRLTAPPVAPSAAAAAAMSLKERLRARMGAAWHTSGLGHPPDPFAKLGKVLLDFTPDARELTRIRALIDRAIDAWQNPPPPPVLHVGMLELARDLGVTLPADLEQAQHVLARRLSDAVTDRRVRVLAETLCGQVLAGGGDGSLAVRCRHALVGYGLPAVRRDDAVYAVDDLAQVWPPLPPGSDAEGGDGAALRERLERLEPVAKLLGVSLVMPPFPPGPDVRAERKALDIERNHKRLVPGGDYEANNAAYEEASDKLRARAVAHMADLQRAELAFLNAARNRIMAAVDAKAAALWTAEPGGFRWISVRELACALRCDPAAAPLFLAKNGAGAAYVPHALEQCRQLGITFDIGAAS